MNENRRVPIYRFFARFRHRCLTPAERIELDRLLDEAGARRRPGPSPAKETCR
ncbi:MAG TPA: hypothetical protein VGF77_10560 [Allosphingosinicella sp.]|jgi:hypothetical protein